MFIKSENPLTEYPWMSVNEVSKRELQIITQKLSIDIVRLLSSWIMETKQSRSPAHNKISELLN